MYGIGMYNWNEIDCGMLILCFRCVGQYDQVCKFGYYVYVFWYRNE